MFRPLSRSHHQGVRNPWELQSHCIDLLGCCYVYVFASRYDSCVMLSIPQHSNSLMMASTEGPKHVGVIDQ